MSDIYGQLASASAALPGIGKDSVMKAKGGPTYNYRGIEDILPHVAAAFNEHSVVVVPSYTVLSTAPYQVSSGAVWQRVVLQGTFTFYSALDGSSVEAVTIGEGTDMGDKAYNKAMTAAYKYALIQTLCINDGDDGDAASPEPAVPQFTQGDAKQMILAACSGDIDCAREMWDRAGFGAEVTRDAVEAFLASDPGNGVDLAETSKPSDIGIEGVDGVETTG